MINSLLGRLLVFGVVAGITSLGHAATRSLSYELTPGGGGYNSGDPPPDGFFDTLFGKGTVIGTIEYDDSLVVPVPFESSNKYRYLNLTRISLAFGNDFYETQIPDGVFVPMTALTQEEETFRLGAGVIAESSGPGVIYDPCCVFPVVGPTAQGLTPHVLSFDYFNLGGSIATFPSYEVLQSGLPRFVIGFLTPSGNNVNVAASVAAPMPVPEPETWLLVSVGVALLGLSSRGRKRLSS